MQRAMISVDIGKGFSAMITHIEDYFAKGCDRCKRFATPACSTQFWKVGLAQLRHICLDEGLTEAVKWGHPAYMHNGRNIVIIGAFRDNFRLNFFHPALMNDPEGLLEKQGPNTHTAGMLRFTSDAQVTSFEPIIRAYLREAIGYADAGIMPDKVARDDPDLGEELIAAMDDDPTLAEAFHALTPGRQRGWNLHFTSAKQAATRAARVQKATPKIFAGKGWNER